MKSKVNIREIYWILIQNISFMSLRVKRTSTQCHICKKQAAIKIFCSHHVKLELDLEGVIILRNFQAGRHFLKILFRSFLILFGSF